MNKDKTIVLEAQQIRQKLIRIAYEIYENNFEKEGIVIMGIKGSGLAVAKKVFEHLSRISDTKITFVGLKMKKNNPQVNDITSDVELNTLDGQTIVIVDDVINSGKTMAFAVYHMLPFGFESIKVAVLVDRQHRQYPVKTDYVGLTLSTTLQDHIEVNAKEEVAYLI